jgi:hypothetical protein
MTHPSYGASGPAILAKSYRTPTAAERRKIRSKLRGIDADLQLIVRKAPAPDEPHCWVEAPARFNSFTHYSRRGKAQLAFREVMGCTMGQDKPQS